MTGRTPRSIRPRDALGRPMPYGSTGVARQPEGIDRTPAEALRAAHDLLAAGLPFHAHEVLEDAWKAGPDEERELWRGLAQLAVGATHAARGNRSGAVALLRRGRAAIAAAAVDPPHGLDIAAIMRWCDDSVAGVTAQCPLVLPGPPLLPR